MIYFIYASCTCIVQVGYFATVDSVSIRGVRVLFEESGEAEVPATENRVTFGPLTPGTAYQFDIRAVSDSSIGMTTSAEATTLDVEDGEYIR